MVTGYLKVIVLRELNSHPHTGYELMKKVTECTGSKPSAGSIYPLLNELLEAGYVSVKEDGRRKIYSITVGGKKAIAKFLKEKEQLITKHLELMEIVGSIAGKNEQKEIMSITNKVRSNGEFCLRNIDVWVDLKRNAIKLAADSKNTLKQKKMRQILKDAARRLRSLNTE